jgi:hypothetical protein
MDNPEDRAKQTEQRRDHANIGQINHTIIQTGRDSCSFRFGDFSDLLKICIRILGREIKHFLHDSGNGFSVPIGNGEQSQIVAFAQKCVRCRHVTARYHRAAPDRHEIYDH